MAWKPTSWLTGGSLLRIGAVLVVGVLAAAAAAVGVLALARKQRQRKKDEAAIDAVFDQMERNRRP